ncbi:alpha/beta fold hydrolase [Haloferax sp. YSSS75]|uniref:alpha/beta fold hydrolase n=1 Tax=Haloferax sp. YSSS75 TaxID=3388564 RepID=UPI00398C9EEC
MPDQPPDPFRIHDGLAVYRFGDSGDPVLLMPGPHRFQRPGLRSADALIDGLVALGRQVITFDPPGSGASTRPASLSMEEMHDCATESLDVCEVSDPVDVVGHSMGGLVTLAFTLEHPARVARLVLVGTGAGGPSYMDAPGALWNRSHPAFWRLAVLGTVHLVWPRLATERHLNNFVARHSFVDQRFVETEPVELRDWIRPKEGRAEWHRIARTVDYTPRLGEISVPTLVLCGTHDPQFPPTASKQLAEGITDSRLVFFEQSGHYPFIEEPDAFWAEVARFLAE